MANENNNIKFNEILVKSIQRDVSFRLILFCYSFIRFNIFTLFKEVCYANVHINQITTIPQNKTNFANKYEYVETKNNLGFGN